MLLAEDAMFFGPTSPLLRFLENMGINRLHLAFPFSPFHFGRILGLVADLCIVLNVLEVKK